MKECRVPGKLFNDGKWAKIAKMLRDADIDINKCSMIWDFDTDTHIYKQEEGE